MSIYIYQPVHNDMFGDSINFCWIIFDGENIKAYIDKDEIYQVAMFSRDDWWH